MGTAVFLFLSLFFWLGLADEGCYLYSDKWHIAASVKLTGEKNGKSITVTDEWKRNVYEGERCIRISSDISEVWKIIEIDLAASGASGDSVRIADLSAYDYLEFFARADSKLEAPYAVKEIGLRTGSGFKHKRSEMNLEIGQMWQKYRISLKGLESGSGTPQLFMSLWEGNLYLDEIKLVKKQSKRK